MEIRNSKGQFKKGFIPSTAIKKGEHRGIKTQFKKGENLGNTNGFKKGIQNNPNGEFPKGHIPWRKGLKFPQQSLAQMGDKNPFWKGGITPLGKQIRMCLKYRQWRSDCFTRDEFTCQRCGAKGGKLSVDHYPKMFSRIIEEYHITKLEEALACEELWNLNNGLTVCWNDICHPKKKHGLQI